MKLSYEQIGRIIDIFNERLATKLEEAGLSICTDKAYICGDCQDTIVNCTSNDDKNHAIINISELLAIDFNKFDYHLVVNNIGDEVDVEYSIDKVSDSYLVHTIYCAYDIIIISSKSDVYIQTLNHVHRPEYPTIMTESADVDEECILNAIKNGKMYGIDIIIDRKDNENDSLQ